jgi:hypothetical protein
MSTGKKKAAENHGQKVSVKELTLIKRLVKDRTPTAEIAGVVGRSLAALRKITHRAGLSLRKIASKKKSVKPAPKKKARKKTRAKSPVLIH